MKWNHFLIKRLGIFIPILFASQALAYDEPAVNLGFTSFFDAMPPSGTGFYFQDYLQYYTTDRLNGNNGNRLSLPRTDLDTTVNLAQLVYLSNKRIGNANFGVVFIAPWLMKAHFDDGSGGKAQTGVGDVIFGPALQFDPIMGPFGPRFAQRIEFDVIAPTGRYDRNYAVNPGSNFWSINPYWAGTLWFIKEWSASVRLHYLWNAKNTDPNVSFGPDANSTQAGQAVFADIATEYSVTEKFFVGLNGYIFDQFTDTKVNGDDVPRRREYVWAIGPGLLASLTRDDFVFFNSYFEQDAKNRSQGSNFILRYAHHFS